MSNFWKRAITGTVFVVVMVGGIWWNYWSLSILLFLISMLGLNEFYGLLHKAGYKPQRWVGLTVGAIIFAMFVFKFYLYGELIFPMMIPFVVTIFFVELYRKQQTPFINIALTVTGIFYIVLPFALWVNRLCPFPVSLHNKLLDMFAGSLPTPYNPHVLLGFFFILWTNDTGAYLSGMALGKHKLWERISPKKTWEGFIGGIILSVGVAYLISRYYTDFNALLWMLIGLTVSIFGTLGDLTESLFKRSIDVKESGGLLPGHGGILDRFDGVFLSTPFVLAVIQVTEYIQAQFS